jgi:hypothetical protein
MHLIRIRTARVGELPDEHEEGVGLYGPKRKFGSLRPDFGSFESS